MQQELKTEGKLCYIICALCYCIGLEYDQHPYLRSQNNLHWLLNIRSLPTDHKFESFINYKIRVLSIVFLFTSILIYQPKKIKLLNCYCQYTPHFSHVMRGWGLIWSENVDWHQINISTRQDYVLGCLTEYKIKCTYNWMQFYR